MAHLSQSIHLTVAGLGLAICGNKRLCPVSVTVTITGIVAVSDIINGSPFSVDPSDRCWSARVLWAVSVSFSSFSPLLLSTFSGTVQTGSVNFCLFIFVLFYFVCVVFISGSVRIRSKISRTVCQFRVCSHQKVLHRHAVTMNIASILELLAS